MPLARMVTGRKEHPQRKVKFLTKNLSKVESLANFKLLVDCLGDLHHVYSRQTSRPNFIPDIITKNENPTMLKPISTTKRSNSSSVFLIFARLQSFVFGSQIYRRKRQKARMSNLNMVTSWIF